MELNSILHTFLVFSILSMMNSHYFHRKIQTATKHFNESQLNNNEMALPIRLARFLKIDNIQCFQEYKENVTLIHSK